jgi:transposase
VDPLPREGRMPDLERVYRENIALKAQLDALEASLYAARKTTRTRDAPLPVRAAQVFAWLITRGQPEFQQQFLSAPVSTIRRWVRRFLGRDERSENRGGRPKVPPEVVTLIVTLRTENAMWGALRIHQELRRLGVKVSVRSIRRILAEHGFAPRPGRPLDFSRVRAAARDALWALDYFAVRTAQGALVQVLLVIDVFTREWLELKVHDGWDVDAAWTTRTFAGILRRERRTPAAVLHDHGPHFLGQFARQLRVLEIEDRLTPTGLPSLKA